MLNRWKIKFSSSFFGTAGKNMRIYDFWRGRMRTFGGYLWFWMSLLRELLLMGEIFGWKEFRRGDNSENSRKIVGERRKDAKGAGEWSKIKQFRTLTRTPRWKVSLSTVSQPSRTINIKKFAIIFMWNYERTLFIIQMKFLQKRKRKTLIISLFQHP